MTHIQAGNHLLRPVQTRCQPVMEVIVRAPLLTLLIDQIPCLLRLVVLLQQ